MRPAVRRPSLRALARAVTIFAATTCIGLRAAPAPVDYAVTLDVIREGYDGERCWVHPRAGIVPSPGGGPPAVVLTLQELWLKGSDVFGPLHELRSDDLGRTWAALRPHSDTHLRA